MITSKTNDLVLTIGITSLAVLIITVIYSLVKPRFYYKVRKRNNYCELVSISDPEFTLKGNVNDFKDGQIVSSSYIETKIENIDGAVDLTAYKKKKRSALSINTKMAAV